MPPEGIFVVHLRSNSTAADVVNGRVEHVKSGASERFSSLADLVSFMTRYAGQRDTAAEKERP